MYLDEYDLGYEYFYDFGFFPSPPGEGLGVGSNFGGTSGDNVGSFFHLLDGNGFGDCASYGGGITFISEVIGFRPFKYRI